jgi:hypothetical protein
MADWLMSLTSDDKLSTTLGIAPCTQPQVLRFLDSYPRLGLVSLLYLF